MLAGNLSYKIAGAAPRQKECGLPRLTLAIGCSGACTAAGLVCGLTAAFFRLRYDWSVPLLGGPTAPSSKEAKHDQC
jgi:hypothetical protein